MSAKHTPEELRQDLKRFYVLQRARKLLIAAAADYDAAAGPAITALAFAQEDAQRRGDAVAFAQYMAAKNGLISAQNKARGHESEILDITPTRAAISKATGEA